MKTINLIINIFASALLISLIAACGNNKSFHISGEIEGLGTRNLKFYYYDGNAVRVGVASALNSKFSFEGSSKKPTLLTITTAQRNILGRLVVENGDAIELKLNASDPTVMNVTGNKTSSDYARFLKANSDVLKSGNSDNINKAIENVVRNNTSKMFATVALLAHYDASRENSMADSLLKMIDPKARPAQITTGYATMLGRLHNEQMSEPVGNLTLLCDNDSLTTFRPSSASRTLLVFTEGISARKDSINRLVNSALKEKSAMKQAVVNISLDLDTASWKKALHEAPGRGLNLWLPGSVSSSRMKDFNINRLPHFVVVDSAGKRLYDGNSASEAISYFNKN